MRPFTMLPSKTLAPVTSSRSSAPAARDDPGLRHYTRVHDLAQRFRRRECEASGALDQVDGRLRYARGTQAIPQRENTRTGGSCRPLAYERRCRPASLAPRGGAPCLLSQVINMATETAARTGQTDETNRLISSQKVDDSGLQPQRGKPG